MKTLRNISTYKMTNGRIISAEYEMRWGGEVRDILEYKKNTSK